MSATGTSAAEQLGIAVWEPYDSAWKRSPDATCPDVGRPMAGDPADTWLREHDPHLRADGVAAEIESALEAAGLDLPAAREAFRKSGGRPSRALSELRERLAAALRPMWDDDRRRDYMAQALGCDRKSLWRLLSKPPHVSKT